MMEVRGDNADALYYRMDDYPPRLVVSPAAQNGVEAIGFEVHDGRELAEMAAAVEGTGTKVVPLDAVECRERRITEGVRFDDPAGNPVELFWGVALSTRQSRLHW